MQRLGRPRIWFAIAAILAFLALFIVGGAAGGVLAFFACAAFIFAVFRLLRGTDPEDRTAWTGQFWGGF
jgi:hypothetical protein